MSASNFLLENTLNIKCEHIESKVINVQTIISPPETNLTFTDIQANSINVAELKATDTLEAKSLSADYGEVAELKATDTLEAKSLSADYGEFKLGVLSNVAEVSNGLKLEKGIIKGQQPSQLTNSDLGFYSTTSGEWIRLATNSGQIKFFTDGSAGAYEGKTEDMRITPTNIVMNKPLEATTASVSGLRVSGGSPSAGKYLISTNSNGDLGYLAPTILQNDILQNTTTPAYQSTSNFTTFMVPSDSKTYGNYDTLPTLPDKPTYTGTIRTANSEATFDSALASSIAGDRIQITGSFNISSSKTISVGIEIYGSTSFVISGNFANSLFILTGNNITIRNLSLVQNDVNTGGCINVNNTNLSSYITDLIIQTSAYGIFINSCKFIINNCQLIKLNSGSANLITVNSCNELSYINNCQFDTLPVNNTTGIFLNGGLDFTLGKLIIKGCTTISTSLKEFVRSAGMSTQLTNNPKFEIYFVNNVIPIILSYFIVVSVFGLLGFENITFINNTAQTNTVGQLGKGLLTITNTSSGTLYSSGKVYASTDNTPITPIDPLYTDWSAPTTDYLVCYETSRFTAPSSLLPLYVPIVGDIKAPIVKSLAEFDDNQTQITTSSQTFTSVYMLAVSEALQLNKGDKVFISYGASVSYSGNFRYNTSLYRHKTTLKPTVYATTTTSATVKNVASASNLQLTDSANGISYIHCHSSAQAGELNSVNASYIDTIDTTGQYYYSLTAIGNNATTATFASGNPNYITVFRIPQ